MNNKAPLYSSRLIKNYLEFIGKHYPYVSIDAVLDYAGITRYEVEDPAHWFNQEQIDRFHKILVQKTGDHEISKEVGRYTASGAGFGAAKQLMIGLMSPTAGYLLTEKYYPILSRGAAVSVKKTGPTSVEIISKPKPGVDEKSYQCENRAGTFEAIAKLFTDKFAKVEHPECFHNDHKHCRYVITWEKTPSLIWKRIRNYFLLLAAPLSLLLFWFMAPLIWGIVFIPLALVAMGISFYAEYLEKQELIHTVKAQKLAAEDHIQESNIRYNNTVLIQEIGQVASKILAVDELLHSVAKVMEKRLHFDRGMIMLANEKKTHLQFSAGYGHTKEQEKFLSRLEFNLKNPESKGLFVQAMREGKPRLINDITEIEDTLSPRSLDFAKRMGGRSVICIPIVYEQEPLGILAVDNIKSKTPLRQSDVNLLMGVTSQLATSIMNAMSFKRLEQSENKYRELVETANSIILRIDTQGRITFSNKFAQRFFGYTETEFFNTAAAEIMWPKSRTTRQDFANWIHVLQRDPDRPLVSENETKLRNGERVWIAWTYKPIFNDDGLIKEILSIGNDITDLKLADIEKKDLQAQLQRAQKMEAIGTLAGGVAHDLNNILSGIVSYPELLLMDLEQDSPLIKPILTIQKSGEKAAAIVQDLLTLARRGVAATEVVNLNSIVSEYLLSPEHEKLLLDHPDVKVSHHLDSNLLNILGSPVHLSKTVMNLVSNAAEAMPEGGHISIRSENRHQDKPLNAFDDIGKGDYVVLTVKDNGIGISPEDIERIFEPFYTKKSMGRSGTGLGMAVVWGTVKDHRGYIDIKSKEGKGTAINLYFPVTRQELDRDDRLFDLAAIKGNGESILIIDDIAEQRQIASEMLEKLGYRVTTVASGEAAVDYLVNHTVDLIVLDMIMDPGIDGLETYQKILQIRPGQKTIIASGYSESERVKEAQRIGAGTYIKKPYLIEKFGRAVKTELNL
ncbi:MAG: response regulator [Deltaproteobacteria bacterium]|jgi:PAS domain S-box-containing protein|nr:response regulator [Deltaproteobacteria bacterium]